MAFDPEYWMRDLAKYINNKPINNILIPGTHDSGSYSNFDFTILEPTQTQIFNIIKPFVSLPCVQSLITSWSITQNNSIYNQLKSGIRTIDLRVSPDINNNNNFYITHTYFAEPLSVILSDLNMFLSAHPTEIIFVQISPDYEYVPNWTSALELTLCQVFVNNLSDYIIPYKGVIPTYSDLINSKKNLVLLYTNFTLDTASFWDLNLFPATWFNFDNPSTQITNFTSYLQGMAVSSSKFNGLLFTVTPQTSTVIQNLFTGGDLETITDNLLVDFNSFFQNNISEFHKLSYITMDFPTTGIINQIISYNITQ